MRRYAETTPPCVCVCVCGAGAKKKEGICDCALSIPFSLFFKSNSQLTVNDPMLRRTSRSVVAAMRGVYVAWHPWLGLVCPTGQLFKIGSSLNLAERLSHTSYTTCYPPGWRFSLVYELHPDMHDTQAARLEAAVLHCLAPCRVANRELVLSNLNELVALIPAVARQLGVLGRIAVEPSYARDAKPSPAVSHSNAPLLSIDEMTMLAASRVAPASMGLLANLTSGAVNVSSTPPSHGCDASEPAGGDDQTQSTMATRPPTLRKRTARLLARQQQGLADGKAASPLSDVIRSTPLVASLHSQSAVRYQLRPYQAAAVTAALEELSRCRRALLHIACRCGKTPIAHQLIHTVFSSDPNEAARITGRLSSRLSRRALYLVPNRPLLKQTAEKLAALGGLECDLLAVGTSHTADLGDGEGLRSTTDPAAIDAFFRKGNAARRNLLVVCTYHSCELLPLSDFDITVCDEAHRMCSDDESSPFRAVLRESCYASETDSGCAAAQQAILFMTATPQWDVVPTDGPGALSMRDQAVFGGVAYRYALGRGITDGYVNDYDLVCVCAHIPAQLDVGSGSPESEEEAVVDADQTAATARCIVTAFSSGGHANMLVYCRSIAQMTALLVHLSDASELKADGVVVLAAHSGMSPAAVQASIKRFAASPLAAGERGEKVILLSCRLIQEGFDMPSLSSVFFAAPKQSRRDLIQSLARPLNKHGAKAKSQIYVPMLLNFDSPDVCRSFDTRRTIATSLLPLVDAIVEEDERVYGLLVQFLDEQQQQPAAGGGGGPQLRVVMADCAKKRQPDEAAFSMLLYSVLCRGEADQTDRLLAPERLPWAAAFAAMKNIVEVHGRYPDEDDEWCFGEFSLPLHPFYKWCTKAYIDYVNRNRAGVGSCRLQPYQVRDLESLPSWADVAIDRDRSVAAACASLSAYLASSGGVAPPILPMLMAYRSLTATPLEAISAILARAVENARAGDSRLATAILPSISVSPHRTLEEFIAACEVEAREFQQRDPDGWSSFVSNNFPGYPMKQDAARRRKALRALLRDPVERREQGVDTSAAEYHCRVCNRTFRGAESYAAHGTSSAHSRRVLVLRRYLKELQAQSDAVVKHLELSASSGDTDLPLLLFKTVRCRLCNVTVGDVQQYFDHCAGTKHRNAAARHYCEICNVVYPTKELFEAHLGGRAHQAKTAHKAAADPAPPSGPSLATQVLSSEPIVPKDVQRLRNVDYESALRSSPQSFTGGRLAPASTSVPS